MLEDSSTYCRPSLGRQGVAVEGVATQRIAAIEVAAVELAAGGVAALSTSFGGPEHQTPLFAMCSKIRPPNVDPLWGAKE